MIIAKELGRAAIIRSQDLDFVPDGDTGAEVATPVSPERGSTWVTLHLVRIAPGRGWDVPESAAEENTAVVFSGSGALHVGDLTREVERGDAAHAPTGRALSLSAGPQGMSAFVWRTVLPEGQAPRPAPETFSSLWDETTQLRGFAGTGQVEPGAARATMNFVFWPGTGSSRLCLHCGIQQPGETFTPHLHTDSDEAFVSFEGQGQMYLEDRWIDVEPGDILYAAPMVLHGTRNPHTGPDARRFVTCGGPTPFDPVLYQAAGVSAAVR
jgi:mannose-6-phosphate isomerase-like protein (cupin superfamily)